MRPLGGDLHHVGIVVPAIAEALPFYRDTLGLEAGPVHEMTEQAVRAVLLSSRRSPAAPPVAPGAGPGGGRIELLEPTDATSGVARFLARRGTPTLHHVCFAVDGLAGVLRDLERAGTELVDREPRRGALGMVAFLHPRAADGVLIELIDRASLIA